MNILLIDGSPAVQSHTSALLAHLSELFAAHGQTEVITLKERQLPYNDAALHSNPEQHPDQGVRDFVAKVAAADVVVLGTPVYHGSFSGLLKSAIDHLVDDAFKGKKLLLVSNAAGVRVSIQGAQQLVIVPRTMGGSVHTRLIGTCKADYEDRDGQYFLTAPDMLQRCQEIVQEIVS